MDTNDCGPVSLKMIADYFGHYYSLQYLKDRCRITREGASLMSISECAEEIGLHNFAIKCAITDVLNIVPLPAIAFWNMNHFVVAYHIDKRFIWISDPARGHVKYSHSKFCEGWYLKGENKGVLLIIAPVNYY